MARIEKLNSRFDCNSPSGYGLLNIGRFAAKTGCYNPPDVTWAINSLGATCGPAAFGAACRTSVKTAINYFPYFPAKNWTTIGDMRKALKMAEIAYLDNQEALPSYGLALLQLKVSAARMHPLYSLRQTHWVAVFGESFYDVNWNGWLPTPIWQELVLERMSFGGKPVIDWEVRNGIEILDVDLIAAAQGILQKEVNQLWGVAYYEGVRALN